MCAIKIIIITIIIINHFNRPLYPASLLHRGLHEISSEGKVSAQGVI